MKNIRMKGIIINKAKKLLTGLGVAICVLCANSITAEAATSYKDSEPNNSASEAQIIMKNQMTATNKASSNTMSYRYVTGTLSGAEEDWYSLFLTASTEDNYYFTISGGTGTNYIQILDSKLEVVDAFSCIGSKASVYKVDIPVDGTYYIRLYRTSSSNSSYKFTFGEPEYLYGSYTHNFGTQNLPKKGKWESGEINFAKKGSLPKDAVGYKITLAGCTSSVSSKRYFKNEFFSSWVATRTSYAYTLPATENASILDQPWEIKYVSSATTNKTITPQVTIQYVYPQLPANEQ